MRVVEIVYEEEIDSFGLGIGEVVEIVKEVLEKNNEGNGIKIYLDDWTETALRFCVKKHMKNMRNSEFYTYAENEMNKALSEVWKRLRRYSEIKPFLHIYSKNGNGTGEIREIFEKAGIEVIS